MLLIHCYVFMYIHNKKENFHNLYAESDRFDLFDRNIFFVIVFLDQDFLIANLFECCSLLLWSFTYNKKQENLPKFCFSFFFIT